MTLILGFAGAVIIESTEFNYDTLNDLLPCLIQTKRCGHCRQEKPKSDFPKWQKNPDGTGLGNICRICNRERSKKYYYTHLEKYRAKSKAYYHRKKAQNPPLPRPPRIKVEKVKPPKFKRPEGSIYKRCRACRHPLYPMPTDTDIQCEKCETEYKIIPAIGISRRNRGGIILQVVF
jgi:hypothetical protein